MSSFLGAGQAGVGMVCLAAGVSVALTAGGSGGAVAIVTPTQKCVPLYLTLRGHTVALDASATVSLGTTGALTSYISARAATSLPTTVGFVATTFVVNSTANTLAANATAAGVTIYASITQTSTATSILCDLIGYLCP